MLLREATLRVAQGSPEVFAEFRSADLRKIGLLGFVFEKPFGDAEDEQPRLGISAHFGKLKTRTFKAVSRFCKCLQVNIIAKTDNLPTTRIRESGVGCGAHFAAPMVVERCAEGRCAPYVLMLNHGAAM